MGERKKRPGAGDGPGLETQRLYTQHQAIGAQGLSVANATPTRISPIFLQNFVRKMRKSIKVRALVRSRAGTTLLARYHMIAFLTIGQE